MEYLLLYNTIIDLKGAYMVVQSKETKASSSLIDLLGGNPKTKNGKTNDAFSQLLASLNTPIKEAKEFSVVVDPKNTKKIDTPKVNLPKMGAITSDEILKADETKMLPKELVDALSHDQIKNLIGRAREYLKNTIQDKAPEYKLEGKEMPKTLLGLVELADKIGINLTEITLTTIDDAQKPLFKDLPLALVQKSLIELKEPQTSKETKGKEVLATLLNDTAIGLSELPTSHKETEKAVSIQPLQSLLKAVDTHVLAEAVKEVVPKEPSKISLTTHTGELTPHKEVEKGSSQPLQSFLKAVDSNVLPDAVKDIVPKEAVKVSLPTHIDALGALLKGDVESETGEKNDKVKGIDEPAKGLHTNKADSLEVKTKEAAQGMRAFAIDLKEAAESYKPPFTRVTMKLNPEKLGEVEVTLVQRGSNVHVNIQSNNATSVAFLAHNATELKAQLAHQGISGATMSFMSGGDGQPHNPQQQHNRFAAYESLQELEAAQQELSALEIILPHYA